jgi:hypothetical protein
MNSDAGEFAVFGYLYRDASNFKAWGQLLLQGAWSEECQRELDASAGDGLFVAEQVGIPALYAQLHRYFGGHRTADDQAFHEIDCVRQATVEDVRTLQLWGTAAQLLQAFKQVGGEWDVRISPP